MFLMQVNVPKKIQSKFQAAQGETFCQCHIFMFYICMRTTTGHLPGRSSCPLLIGGQTESPSRRLKSSSGRWKGQIQRDESNVLIPFKSFVLLCIDAGVLKPSTFNPLDLTFCCLDYIYVTSEEGAISDKWLRMQQKRALSVISFGERPLWKLSIK